MHIHKHRPVSIGTELVLIRDVASLLRNGNSDSILRDRFSGLLESRIDAPAPLIELFNWTHAAASKDRALESSRDTLYELITLCSRVNRRCIVRMDYPDVPVEPLNELGTADRLEFLVDKLLNEGGSLAHTG
jgi:hypothetical protein